MRASLLLLVSAMARLNCSRMVLSSDERCSVLCSATRRRSFKAWNSLWYAISFSVTKKTYTEQNKVGYICICQHALLSFIIIKKKKPLRSSKLQAQQALVKQAEAPWQSNLPKHYQEMMYDLGLGIFSACLVNRFM